MKPLLLCHPRCTTCRRALDWLAARGIEVEVRDIVACNPSAEELDGWIGRSGLPVARFFNTSGLRYKALGLKEVVPTLDRGEALRLLASDGMLIRRPLLVADRGVRAGFREKEWEELLVPERR